MLGIKAITGLIPIHLHLQKLNGRFHFRALFLPSNYIIKLILETRDLNDSEPHQLSLKWLMHKQQLIVKGPLVDMDNRCNKNFPFFSPFNSEFSLGNRLIDVFPNHFLFHSLNRKSNHDVKSYLHHLDSITLQASLDPQLVVVVTDASIKNQIATSILHINIHDNPIIKTIHHAVNIMSAEAELFVIKYSINQAICLPNVN